MMKNYDTDFCRFKGTVVSSNLTSPTIKEYMFSGKRRFDDTRAWVKVEENSLDEQFKNLSDDYDIFIIRHWFYCMATAPITISYDSKKKVESYLKDSVSAGDRIEIWAFILDSNNITPYVSAKMPDENGLIPLKGAY